MKGKYKISKRDIKGIDRKIQNMGDDRPAWLKKKYQKDDE